MTPEPNQTPQEFLDQIEQHEFVKQQGIEAWADAVSEMLPNCSEDQRILIKEGFKAVLQGPPAPRMLHLPTMPAMQVDAEFVPPPAHIFEHTNPSDGSITCWDWRCLAARGTHATLYTDGRVRIFKGDELVITLTDEPATKFWEWKQAYLKLTAQMIVPPGVS